jgi:plastocyanin
MPMRRVAIMCLVALMLAACGGGGGSGDGSDASGGAPEPAPSPSAEQVESSFDTDCNTAPPAKLELALTSIDGGYKPAKLKAPAGEEVMVTLTNKGTQPHSFSSKELRCSSGAISSAAGKVSVTFTMPAEQTPFFCIVHPRMTGTLTPA